MTLSSLLTVGVHMDLVPIQKKRKKIYGVYLPLLFRVRIRTRVIGYLFVNGFQYCYTQRLTMIRFMQK